ncbi:MAG: molybdopterin-dependent oxidoreductase [Tissierellia bacterium]|nr:molybdopterin-dependent oxidoreductase [Tissierellia bacterium]
MKNLNKNYKKIDSEAIITGKPIYTDDLASSDSLIIKLKRSDFASGLITKIDKEKALKTEGVVEIFTYEDVPKTKFTLAGQSHPEPSGTDTLILSQKIRYYGEPVAIVVAENERSANIALEKIKIEYEKYPVILEPEDALKSDFQIQEDVEFPAPPEIFGYDLKHNIAGAINKKFGNDFNEEYQKSEVKLESQYNVTAQAHAMMETYRSFASIDHMGRLVVVSSTQVPFHIKRQLAKALEISPSKVRIIKPRIGGGFGGKQTSVTEIYAGFVTWKLKRPSKIVLDRKETFSASNTRHKMKIKVLLGGEKDGTINCIKIKALSDQGAYTYHAFTTLGLVGDKTLPLYPHLKSAEFDAKVVYTNKLPGAAFRGYGAVQGTFAVESCVNEFAKKIGKDPVDIRLKNMIKEGETPVAYGMKVLSCKLDECVKKAKELINWDDIYPKRTLEDGTIEAVGMSIAQQGSGIAVIDNANATVRLNPEGDYTLLMSPTDNGQGVDTIMVRIAAEILETNPDNIIPVVADTDVTPFDPGSYASSGVYTTGGAVKKACENLKEEILKEASIYTKKEKDQLELHDDYIYFNDQKLIHIKELSEKLTTNVDGKAIEAKGSFASPTSPPPFMTGFAKIHLNPHTGIVKVKDYVAVVDCGTVMSKNLARVQVEGGVSQSIGYALYENATWRKNGKLRENSFINYKIPARGDIENITVDFCESYEPTGPFGAKSIGELVSDTPAPAIANALLNATDKAFRDLPFLPNNIFKKLNE